MNRKALNIANKKLVWFAVACVIVVNAAILGKVLFNRSQVTATLQLSERELQLPYNYGFAKEDSSRRVALQWRVLYTENISNTDWSWQWNSNTSMQLNEAHFSSFNFPACGKSNEPGEKKLAWVLLEFNGQSYLDHLAQAKEYLTLAQQLTANADNKLEQKTLAEKREDATRFLEETTHSASRLFVIDAAADKSLLESALKTRQQQGASLLIVPAEIRASYNRCNDPRVKPREIVVLNLAVESLYVPKDFAEGLPLHTIATDKARIHFTADIHYGRLNEPWIANLKYCEKDCS